MSGQVSLIHMSGIMQGSDLHEFRTNEFDFSKIQGTNCYCDQEALEEIEARLAKERISPVRLIDSGNYHYLSYSFMKWETEPFDLLVFDNHTDAQPAAFGGLLSCGSWVSEALHNLPMLQNVILVGPDLEACRQIDDEIRSRISVISREALNDIRNRCSILDVLPSCAFSQKRVYLSVDKDILNKDYARTTWSQGDVSLSELCAYILDFQKMISGKGASFVAADICGEEDMNDQTEKGKEKNAFANLALLNVLKDFL